MKYIIDFEKIEGTNLWKAKEFNTLVFDKNGLMKLMTLEDELGDYHDDLRYEIYELRRKLADSEIEVVEDLKKDNKRLWEKVCNEKHERIWWKHLYDEKDREFNILKKEIEELKNKKHKENVPIEDVVEYAILEETIDKKTHSTREYERLTHTIKSQKGIIKKQGKDISRLQKEKKKLNNLLTKLIIKNMNLELENKELKQRCKFQDIERLRKSIVKLIEENEILKTELKKRKIGLYD